MTKFKPGDKVRRKPEWGHYAGWALGNLGVIVAEVRTGGGVKVAEDHRIWVMDRFDLVERAEPQPYAIQAKDFDNTKQERQLSNGTWSTSRPLSAAIDAWLVVRDKTEPEPVKLVDRLLSLVWESVYVSRTTALDIANTLIREGYATQYPSKAEEA